jgi:hypothetical protein
VVGDTYRRWLSDEAGESTLTLEGPDLNNVPPRTTFASKGMQAEYGPLLVPGFYEIESVTREVASTESLAVSIDPQEGAMQLADLEALNLVGERVQVHSVDAWNSVARVSADSTDIESLLARRLLAVVLCLLLIEPILARTFRVGVVLLLAMSGAIVLQFVITLLR